MLKICFLSFVTKSVSFWFSDRGTNDIAKLGTSEMEINLRILSVKLNNLLGYVPDENIVEILYDEIRQGILPWDDQTLLERFKEVEYYCQ